VILKGSVSVIRRQDSSNSKPVVKDSIFVNTENPASTEREAEIPHKRRNAVEADGFDGAQ